ncbi:MAG: protoporphyrinogen oxidase [Halobacteriaceae archaeon]
MPERALSMTVGIVGAGVTGLALTHRLADRDTDSVAFEASDEPGGVVRSETEDGRVLERGPQRTRLTPGIESLVDDVGLRGDMLTADPELPMYVYANGRLGVVPFSVRKFLTTDLLSWRGKLRVLAEPLTAQGHENETAAHLFRRKFGDEAYENFIGPLFGGIYGSDPAEMPAGYAPSPILDLERRSGSLLRPAIETAFDNESKPPISFTDGMQALPRALHEEHADRVRLDTPVTAVREVEDGYRIETEAGAEPVDDVVLTTPADATADILDELVPDAAARLRRLNYNPLALVYLDADHAREGFGYQVRREEGLRTLGVSWNASLFDRDGVHTAFLGGMNDSEILDESDDFLGTVASEEFRQVMGVESDVIDVVRLDRGFPAWDRSWRHLDDLELPDGVHLATNYTARMGLPGRIREAASLADELSD